MERIEEYGQLAGFILNKSKTKLLTKNVDSKEIEELQQKTGMMMIEKKVKYLGVWLTSKNINLYKDNYEKVWNEVKRYLEIWGRMKLSFMGRISAIKMSVLPRMLFLFQTIPIISGTGQFNIWQKRLSKFVWQGGKPRMKYKLLTDVKERGGFSLPDFKIYYVAPCFCWLKDWMLLDNTDLLDLEGFDKRFGWHT